MPDILWQCFHRFFDVSITARAGLAPPGTWCAQHKMATRLQQDNGREVSTEEAAAAFPDTRSAGVLAHLNPTKCIIVSKRY